MRGERQTPNAERQNSKRKPAPPSLRSFELGMEAVKTLEGPHENLLVADALLRPTFQYLIKTKSFER